MDNASSADSGGLVSYVSVGEPLETIIIPSFGSSVSVAGKAALEHALDRVKKIVPADSKHAPFCGGAVGYLSYECLGFFEKIKLRSKPLPEAPSAAFVIPGAFAAFDSASRRAFLFCAGQSKSVAAKNLGDIKLPSPSPRGLRPSPFRASPLTRRAHPHLTTAPDFTAASFSRAVRKVKNYIAAGDIFQANIARRWCVPLDARSPSPSATSLDGKDTFLALRRINPSPYACYLKFNDVEIISSSPELLVRRRGDIIETRPLAGTRPRGLTPPDDRRLGAELLLDPKERAEHIMLVDLERNDIGRVSRPSTVRVNEKMVLEKYSHVTHIVSNVCGRLKRGVTQRDILGTMFPGGTITGCPKIRAIEIIDEVEPVARGPYCGSAGWFSPTGDMELNILIRTIIKTPLLAEFYAGAGIVADSKPLCEYRETAHKAEALALALGVKI
ncbi:MAG: anthranilate synthase component I family protein [Endomicrobiia bacterium]|nr:anthranilate synthase component I family protein [Endomicrobiia bacterium]